MEACRVRPELSKTVEQIDKSLWRLNIDSAGGETWEYVTKEEAEKRPLTIAEKYFLGFDLVSNRFLFYGIY